MPILILFHCVTHVLLKCDFVEDRFQMHFMPTKFQQGMMKDGCQITNCETQKYSWCNFFLDFSLLTFLLSPRFTSKA